MFAVLNIIWNYKKQNLLIIPCDIQPLNTDACIIVLTFFSTRDVINILSTG